MYCYVGLVFGYVFEGFLIFVVDEEFECEIVVGGFFVEFEGVLYCVFCGSV